MVRRLSETGFYHITQRGNARGFIFETDDDRRLFLRLLKQFRDEYRVRVITWCLMDDHYHLVLDVNEARLDEIMHRLNYAYARRFNIVHQRDGHVFQGRYYSGPISTDAQLLATIVYVHQNPQAAGICPTEDYRWSGLQECLGKRYVADVDFVLSLFGGLANLLSYQKKPEDIVLAEGIGRGLPDEIAREIAEELLGKRDLGPGSYSQRDDRDAAVRTLASQGISQRQIGRILGIGRATVASIVKAST